MGHVQEAAETKTRYQCWLVCTRGIFLKRNMENGGLLLPKCSLHAVTSSTSDVSSTISAKAPLSCGLDPNATQLSSQARWTAPRCSSSNFWRSLVFAWIVLFSSAHCARPHFGIRTFCCSLINQAGAAECTSSFTCRSAKPYPRQAPVLALLQVLQLLGALIDVHSKFLLLRITHLQVLPHVLDTNSSFSWIIPVVSIIFLTVSSSPSRANRRTFPAGTSNTLSTHRFCEISSPDFQASCCMLNSFSCVKNSSPESRWHSHETRPAPRQGFHQPR